MAWWAGRSNRNVFRNANNIISPPGHIALPFTKHDKLPKDLVKPGSERGEPPRSRPDRDEGAGHGTLRMRGTLTYLKTGGLLNERTLLGTKPFATTCIDFMDSVTVRETGSKRTTTEVCPMLIVCQDMGAVYTQVAYDLNTSAFLLHWDHFVAELGRPTKVVIDQGSRRISSDTADLFDWARVEGREAE